MATKDRGFSALSVSARDGIRLAPHLHQWTI